MRTRRMLRAGFDGCEVAGSRTLLGFSQHCDCGACCSAYGADCSAADREEGDGGGEPEVSPGDGESRGWWVEDACEDLDEHFAERPSGERACCEAGDCDVAGFAPDEAAE